VILYVNGASQLLEVLAETGADALGIDWRVDPRDALRRIGARCALQGNLDPSILFAPADAVEREARRVLDGFGGAPGHVFNLGSGILPGTPVASMERIASVLSGAR
jgi:uroporphyrinogen decarboxylase